MWDSGKIKAYKYKAKYTQQRDLIVQVSLMAKNIYEGTKPVLKLQNPNFVETDLRNSVFTDRKKFNSRIYWKDRVLPPRSERKYKATRIKTFFNEQVFI